MIFDILKIIFEKVYSAFGSRRNIRLTVHRAFFTTTAQECFFVNVTNLSTNREIEVTHIWFDCKPQVSAIHLDRMLPKRLKPEETWETWVEVKKIPIEYHFSVYTLARARLSNGKIIKSVANKGVPFSGIVPGGSIQHNSLKSKDD
jgi:hypothetical protein